MPRLSDKASDRVRCLLYSLLIISQSYFEAAKEKFAIFESKMSSRLLGTEKKNPVEQGYEAEHYGLHYMAISVSSWKRADTEKSALKKTIESILSPVSWRPVTLSFPVFETRLNRWPDLQHAPCLSTAAGSSRPNTQSSDRHISSPPDPYY